MAHDIDIISFPIDTSCYRMLLTINESDGRGDYGVDMALVYPRKPS
jgi:hypothetical protein